MAPYALQVPIEALQLPAELDGSAGSNRAVGHQAQIAAADDVSAIRAWLARMSDSPATLQSYRKEAERFTMWAVHQLGKPVSSITHEDMLLYRRFLGDPRPFDRWVAKPGKKYPRHDARWRPFYGPLSAPSQRQALVILNTMFAWLVEAGYLAGNPLSLSRGRAKRAQPRVTRLLDQPLWQEVKASIGTMQKESDTERAHYFRARWLFTLFYLGGVRISEAANTKMGAFFARRDSDGEQRWWLAVIGKGGKERLVPATSELMVELARYRRECGLAPAPAAGEDLPLVLPLRGVRKPLTRAALHAVVKKVFAAAAARLRARGGDEVARAQILEMASAHWLRHTAGSHMADGDVDLRHIRDSFGHESLTTTSQYLHSEDDKRHKETEARHRIRW